MLREENFIGDRWVGLIRHYYRASYWTGFVGVGRCILDYRIMGQERA